ncbi:ABC-2 transporter permease [Oceanobacillus bengalensis]|uniref:ABC-2 transporter permease n=2 Tax=Oceanobacillus bengalensis TaxID=1435466 RepID=A0A494YUR4_9BACI|nr:ABC-2 transporter permease [Oceanobacillus bengalensis]RKQ13895.1 ABC-2 transporter permease [Oceanobacillus bengalensis]
MFNLIRKDIVLQKQIIMILLPVLLIYLLLDSSSILVGYLFSTIMIMVAFSIDEKSEINILLNSLPYTRKQIVSSKYIGVFIFTFLVVFTIFIGNLIIHKEITPWKDILFIFSLVMVFTALILPFSYKFKSQYLLIASPVLFVIYMVVVTFFIKNLNDKIREFVQALLTSQNSQLYWLIVLSVVAIYVCSWFLSIRIYRKKVF